MHDLRRRQVHMVVLKSHGGHRAADNAAALIAALARDDLLLGRLAAQIVVVPDELGLGSVGVRAGHAVEHLAHPTRGHLHDGDRTGSRVRPSCAPHTSDSRLAVGLARDRFSHFGAAIADIDAVKACKAVDKLIAMRILDADALSRLHVVGSPSLPGRSH